MPGRQDIYLGILSSAMGRKEVDWLCSEAMLSSQVFDFFFSQLKNENQKIAWHSAWVLEKASEAQPEIYSDSHYEQLIDFTSTNQHDGLQRLCLSVIFNLPIRQPISVDFINRCFEQMISPKETVGVQVLSMKILDRICTAEPDITPELISTLENTDDGLYSRGFAAAKKNLIKRLITGK